MIHLAALEKNGKELIHQTGSDSQTWDVLFGDDLGHFINPLSWTLLLLFSLGGCVRAIFALLKTSCLLPYYFERIFKKLQKTSKNFNMRSTLATHTQNIQYEYSHFCAEISKSTRAINYQLLRRTHMTLVSAHICLVLAYLHQSER